MKRYDTAIAELADSLLSNAQEYAYNRTSGLPGQMDELATRLR